MSDSGPGADGWDRRRAGVLVGLAGALFLLGLASDGPQVAPPPECAAHVEVVRPGEGGARVLCLPADQLADAVISARAGLLPCALPDDFVARDGDRIVAPDPTSERCAAAVGRMSGPALLALGLPLDVNRASAVDLEVLPGIGPVLAARIVERARVRPFSRVEELDEVRGIGPATLAGIRGLVETGRAAATATRSPADAAVDPDG